MTDATTLQQENAILRKALETALQGINDWLHIYAPDECRPERVDESRKRVHEHGTLAYIAELNRVAREALATRAEQPEPIGYCSDYGLKTLSERAHHYTLSVSRKAENEFVNPVYGAPPARGNSPDAVAAILQFLKEISDLEKFDDSAGVFINVYSHCEPEPSLNVGHLRKLATLLKPPSETSAQQKNPPLI